jgi:hypothetical protein
VTTPTVVTGDYPFLFAGTHCLPLPLGMFLCVETHFETIGIFCVVFSACVKGKPHEL